MTRLFTFGCSFTNYDWPTWADILGLEYDHYENWGRIGAGNHFIFCSLMECLASNNITKDDTIIIMWTSVDREDRFINGKWQFSGPISDPAVNEQYGNKFINNIVDINHYLLSSLTMIAAAKDVLSKLGCTWHFTSMFSLRETRKYNYNFSKVPDDFKNKSDSKLFTQICNTFNETINCIHPSFVDTVFAGDISSAKQINIPQVTKLELAKLEREWNNIKGINWPEFNKFVDDIYMDLPSNIRDEICNHYEFDLKIKYIIDGRPDKHPTPAEALEYLKKIKIIKLTDTQEQTALKWNKLLLSGKDINFKALRAQNNRLGSKTYSKIKG